MSISELLKYLNFICVDNRVCVSIPSISSTSCELCLSATVLTLACLSVYVTLYLLHLKFAVLLLVYMTQLLPPLTKLSLESFVESIVSNCLP